MSRRSNALRLHEQVLLLGLRHDKGTMAGALVLVAAALVACGGSTDRAAENAEAVKAAEAAKANARAEADAKLAAQRLVELWSYATVPAGRGQQVTASIRSQNDVDTGEGDPRSVLLVFRDHPSWGRSSYLVLQSGDFACGGRCTVKVIADTRPAAAMTARRPRTDEAIAMFINDAAALWKLTTASDRVSVEFPVKAGGTRTATFEVSGLDPAKMPGWSGP
jgi:hypothetical protein